MGKQTLSHNYGAGKETRTLDLYLGKVSLYQLSYSRKIEVRIIGILPVLSRKSDWHISVRALATPCCRHMWHISV